MSASVFSLPIPLILLIHLHILEYPHANKPEYDHNVFEPRVRGLKERTKLLEDVSYFLVGRLEGSAKTILATYPCLVPSDTVAFRTSLSKYVETLRHNSIYPASKALTGANGPKSKGKEPAKAAADVVPWWWKDVVVRKSLLEECAGERFERLLLSVSTHALFKGSASLSARIDLENLNETLRSQPTIYASLLTKCNQARHIWAHSASKILQREADLHALRERLQSSGGEGASKYSSLSTDRLVALVDSKYQDLLRGSWTRKVALEFLVNAAGIERPVMVLSKTSTTDASDKDLIPGSQPQPQPQPQLNHTTPVQPLPIAAAHHPTYIHKLRRPVFPTTTKPTTSISTKGPSTPTLRAAPLTDRYEGELRTQCVLGEALGKIRQVGRELVELQGRANTKPVGAGKEERKGRRVGAMGKGKGKEEGKRKDEGKGKGKGGKAPLAAPCVGDSDLDFVLDLWEPGPVSSPLDFGTKPTPELLASLSLSLGTDEERGLEARIDEIRDRILPAYPPVVDLAAPRVAHCEVEPSDAEKGASKIPRGGHAPKMTVVQGPRGARQGTSHWRAGDNNKGTTTKRGKAGTETEKSSSNPKLESTLKSKPRKSIRMSLAAHAQRRPSLFASENPSSDNQDEDDEDIQELVHSLAELDHEQDVRPMTPDSTTPLARKVNGKGKVNRIFTGSRTRIRKEEESPGVFQEPKVPLPSLVAASESFDGLLGDSEAGAGRGSDGDEGGGVEELGRKEAVGDVEYEGDGGSMTLRDILLSADVTGFASLDLDHDEGGPGEVGDGGDVSFEWE